MGPFPLPMGLLLYVDLYTDSICDKPVQMLDPSESKREQQDNKKQFGPGDGTFGHGVCTDMDEFSELLSRVSTMVLWFQLMREDQRKQCRLRWRIVNLMSTKLPKEPEELELLRPYALKVVKEDHVAQWEKAARDGKLVALKQPQ